MNTPIILADEPTGNLDKKSSESVLKLLHDLSKDKLVIVVTHNYDQIEKYVTRKITMHDGKVINDEKIRDYENVTNVNLTDFSDIKWYNKVRLGVRNAFNIFPKFILIFTVYLFILTSIFFSYSSLKEIQHVSDMAGTNYFFNNFSDKRIVIKKNDKTSISDEDYNKISKLNNVDYIVKNDILVDTNIELSSDNYYFNGIVSNISLIDKVDYGRLPKDDNEIVLEIYVGDYYMDYKDDLLNTEYIVEQLSNDRAKYKVKIVGLKYGTEMYNRIYYVTDKFQNDISENSNKKYSTIKYNFMDVDGISYTDSFTNEILPSNKVPSGSVIIPAEFIYRCKDNNCKDKSFKVNVSNIYYDIDTEFKVINNTDKKNIYNLTGYKYEDYSTCIFINDKDYNNLFDKGYFQSSVFVKDVKNVRETINKLNNLGYKTLYIADTLQYDSSFGFGVDILKVCSLAILLICLFFISYFIIRLVLKSRNVYYSTLRILGSTLSVTNDLLRIELLTISHTAFLTFTVFILLNYYGVIDVLNIKTLCNYITIGNYVIIYICLLCMTLLITNRYSRKLFKNTVMNTYREEV